ncbi:unnamed protein product, partial [Didymodactylos carnosus]
GCGLRFAPDAPYPYLLALTTKKIDSYDDETLWVAFRRTTNTKDILTDLIVNTTLSISGMVHHGFSKRAFEFPHDRFAYETYQNNAHKRLILTSHSLDGSMAHLCAISHFTGKSSVERLYIYSIAFGAPFVGNQTVAEDY